MGICIARCVRRLLVVALALAPSTAKGGAWTQPQGGGQLIQTFSGWAGQGAAGGRQSKIMAQSYLEYGLADGLTLVGQVSALRYALEPPTRDAYAGLGHAGASLRARLWANDAWSFAFEAGAYVPGARDPRRPAQAGNTGSEADLRFSVGRGQQIFGAPGFAEAQAGYRIRAAGPPGEWRADLTLGVAWTPKAQVLAQLFNVVSQGAGRPGFPSFQSHKGQLSLVYALDEKWSLQIGGFATLYRRGTNSEFGALVAIWRRF